MEPLFAFKRIFFTASAVYISEDFIDIAEAKTGIGGMDIVSLQRTPLARHDPGLTHQNITPEIEKILDAAFADEEKRPVRIAVNVKNKNLILRRFMIRDIAKGELGQAVAFEAQKYVPAIIENLTYGFKTYSTRPGMKDIVFAASETKNVREITEHFETMKILASTVEPVPVLLTRSLFLKKDLKKEAAYLFIHYEPVGRVIICEISHRYPYFFREIVITGGGEEGPAAPAVSQDMSYPTLKSIWTHIERDVIGGMDYLRKETNEKIEKIFISGFAESPDEAGMAQEFGVPFERPDLSFFKGSDSQAKDRHLPALMLLYDSQRKPLLNIAPREIVQSDLWVLKKVAIISMMALGIVLIIHTLLSGINIKKSFEAEKLKRGYDQYAGISRNATKDDIALYNNNLIERSKFINSLVRRKTYLTDKLSQLSDLLPPECWIKSIEYNDAPDNAESLSLYIKGFIFGSPNATDANKLFEDIKQSKILMNGFREAELVSVEKKSLLNKEVTEFEITFK
jgi:hypothetical protein